MTGLTRVATLAATVLLLAVACAAPPDTPPPPPDALTLAPPEGLGLLDVPRPEFDLMNESVRQVMRRHYDILRQRVDADAPSSDSLANAYGEMGNLLMAARYFDATEAYYLNAQQLAPEDPRWSYYLGQVYRNVGPLEESARFFEHARTLQPDDAATEIWLGEVYLSLGRDDDAVTLFDEAVAREPGSAAAWFGAGRAALATGDHATAAEALEQALALAPEATAIHYPLALTYRALGDLDRAQTHIELQGDTEPLPVDPLMAALEELLESPQLYAIRGRRALDEDNWAAAADHFGRGLAMAPDDPFIGQGFGEALLGLGDIAGAEAAFERVIQTTPRHIEAYYSLAEILEATGRPNEAVSRLRTGLESSPGHVRSRVRLAGILGRNGRPQEALEEYDRVFEMSPASSEARLGYAMNLVRLDRYPEAVSQLEEGGRRFPDHTQFPFALARLLAAAPDQRVRNGQRALAIAEGLLEQERSLAVGETLAMALAELGRYADAVNVQQGVLGSAQRARLDTVVMDRLAENLQLYEGGQPCRQPFGADEMP